MGYDKCSDCEREINEGYVYVCDVPECGNVMCLNCVEMIAGFNLCKTCSARDYVSTRTNQKRDPFY